MWITRVSINNPVFAAIVMVALCVLGMVLSSVVVLFVGLAGSGASTAARNARLVSRINKQHFKTFYNHIKAMF